VTNLRSGDHVIWQKKKLCQVVERMPPRTGPTFAGVPPPGKFLDICPYGMTREEWAKTCDDVTSFRVKDLNNEEVFVAEGYDLLYVNPMIVLAVMAKKDDDEQAEAEG